MNANFNERNKAVEEDGSTSEIDIPHDVQNDDDPTTNVPDLIASIDNARPRVEWVYPGNYEGPRHELGSVGEINARNTQNDFTPNEMLIPDYVQNDNDPTTTILFDIPDFIEGVGDTRPRIESTHPCRFERPQDELEAAMSNNVTTDPDYIVHPEDTFIAPPLVEGEIIKPKMCYLRLFSVVVCDDSLPFLMNPKAFIFLFGIFMIIGTNVGILLRDDLRNSSYFPVTARSKNITQILESISGELISINGTAQNKALNWIIYDDKTDLAYNSSRLLQRYAVMVFFYSLSGEDWGCKDGFESEIHECDWYGIYCNLKDQVIEIKLMQNQLQGELPSEMAIFTLLEKLILHQNNISGSIPSCIVDFKNLTELYLFDNELSGRIPPDITRCGNLKRINIHNNEISGTISNSFQDLVRLNILNLSENKLTGTIPTSIGSMPSIQELKLDYNELNGIIPSELGNAITIKNLLLNDNNLSGWVPPEICSISSLEKFTTDCTGKSAKVLCSCCTNCEK